MKTSKQIEQEIKALQIQLKQQKELEQNKGKNIKVLVTAYGKWLVKNPENIKTELESALWIK